MSAWMSFWEKKKALASTKESYNLLKRLPGLQQFIQNSNIISNVFNLLSASYSKGGLLAPLAKNTSPSSVLHLHLERLTISLCYYLICKPILTPWANGKCSTLVKLASKDFQSSLCLNWLLQFSLFGTVLSTECLDLPSIFLDTCGKQKQTVDTTLT